MTQGSAVSGTVGRPERSTEAGKRIMMWGPDANQCSPGAGSVAAGSVLLAPSSPWYMYEKPGLVMVGDLVGEGAAQEQRVIGETPNLAARLQGLAEPGAVVISEGTRRLLGGLFEYIDLGRSELKGFAAPVRAWGVMGESRAESRFRRNEVIDLIG